jgi:uncharacterized membrane protein
MVWVNHHAVFRLISRSDQMFLLLNGILLMDITFANYPTALLANFIGASDQQNAALIYSANGVLIAILSERAREDRSTLGEGDESASSLDGTPRFVL